MTRVAIACVLLTAGLLKGWQLVFAPGSLALQSGVLSSKWAVIAIVEAEMFLAVCLLLNLWRRATWITTLAIFCVFAGYSAFQMIRGANSCGCFGEATIHPSVSLLIDLSAIAVLCVFRPKSGSQILMFSTRLDDAHFRRVANWKSIICTCVLMAVVAFAGIASDFHDLESRIATGTNGVTVSGDGIAIVQPPMWLEKPFPLLQHIVGGTGLAAGDQLLLFYRHNCKKCLDLIGKLRVGLSVEGAHCDVILVEVPPHSSSSRIDSRCHLLLDPSIDWAIPTPLWVQLESGIVRHIN